MNSGFNYQEAFSRNIGWFTEEEQEKLKNTRVAIPGVGGVGGEYLIALTRLGIQNFTIADFDVFETANFNRQYGANTHTIGEDKVSIMKSMAKQINPNVNIQTFGKLDTEGLAYQFVYMADILADSIDFFEIEARRELFRAAARDHIPAITCAPIGMGCSYSIFLNNGKDITFDQACGFKPYDDVSIQSVKFLKFLTGVSNQPGSYLVDPTAIDIPNKKAPSTIIGIKLCAAIMAANIVKIVLKRGTIKPAPTVHFFDPFLEVHKHF